MPQQNNMVDILKRHEKGKEPSKIMNIWIGINGNESILPNACDDDEHGE